MQVENFLQGDAETGVGLDASKTAQPVNKKGLLGYEFFRIMVDNLSKTTFHSIGRVYDTKDLFLRIFFIVSFIASSGICGYLTAKTFITFFSFGVLTSTSMVSDIPAECINIIYLFKVFYL
jgi:hypothetical protein